MVLVAFFNQTLFTVTGGRVKEVRRYAFLFENALALTRKRVEFLIFMAGFGFAFTGTFVFIKCLISRAFFYLTRYTFA